MTSTDINNIQWLVAENVTKQNDGEQGVETPSPIAGARAWKDSKGRYHRIGGPAFISSDGSQQWIVHGVLHREDGPALIHDDGSMWYLNGQRHRINGPAVQRKNGEQQWFIKGTEYSNINAWVKAALEFEGKDINDANIQDKIQQVMQQDLFS